MTPDERENLEEIYADIGGVMASIQMIQPDIRIALMQLGELKWNNMPQGWKDSLVQALTLAKTSIDEVVKNLSTVELTEDNCD